MICKDVEIVYSNVPQAVEWKMGNRFKKQRNLENLVSKAIKSLGYEHVLFVNKNVFPILTKRPLDDEVHDDGQGGYFKTKSVLCSAQTRTYFRSRPTKPGMMVPNSEIHINEYNVSELLLEEFTSMILEHELIHAYVDHTEKYIKCSCVKDKIKPNCINEECLNIAHLGKWLKESNRRDQQLASYNKPLTNMGYSDNNDNMTRGLLKAAQFLVDDHLIKKHHGRRGMQCQKCDIYLDKMNYWESEVAKIFTKNDFSK